MKTDEIVFTILEDGTVKWETNQIGQANHASADQLVKEIERHLGGTSETIRKPHAHAHAHGGKTHVHSH